MAQDTGRFLDFLAHGVEVLANIRGVLVRRFVQEDALDVDAVALVVLRPAGIDCHVFQNLFDRSLAVIYPYIADCGHVGLRIKQRQLAGVACIGRRRLARAAVGVDDNNKMQVRVVVDAARWRKFVLINSNERIAATDIIAGGEMRLTLCAAAPMYSHPAGTCTRAQWR